MVTLNLSLLKMGFWIIQHPWTLVVGKVDGMGFQSITFVLWVKLMEWDFSLSPLCIYKH